MLCLWLFWPVPKLLCCLFSRLSDKSLAGNCPSSSWNLFILVGLVLLLRWRTHLQSVQLEMNGLRQSQEEAKLHSQDLEQECARLTKQSDMLTSEYRRAAGESAEVQRKFEEVRGRTAIGVSLHFPVRTSQCQNCWSQWRKSDENLKLMERRGGESCKAKATLWNQKWQRTQMHRKRFAAEKHHLRSVNTLFKGNGSGAKFLFFFKPIFASGRTTCWLFVTCDLSSCPDLQLREERNKLVEQMLQDREESMQMASENASLKTNLALMEHNKQSANDELTVAKKNVSFAEHCTCSGRQHRA